VAIFNFPRKSQEALAQGGFSTIGTLVAKDKSEQEG
jgi:hypothetical protein